MRVDERALAMWVAALRGTGGRRLVRHEERAEVAQVRCALGRVSLVRKRRQFTVCPRTCGSRQLLASYGAQ